MATRKKADPAALVLHLGGEEFALQKPHTIDGQEMMLPSLDWLEQLTFGEQIEVRRIARDISGNADAEFNDFSFIDIAPAIITVVNKRSNERFTLDDALKLDWPTVKDPPTKAAGS